jgi:hypothetical protein
MSFDEILESWRERSMVGNIEDRNNLVTSFSTTEKLVQVIEKTVQFSFPPLLATVGALLNLIQNKETLHEVLKQIIFGMPYEGLWGALDTMYNFLGGC